MPSKTGGGKGQITAFGRGDIAWTDPVSAKVRMRPPDTATVGPEVMSKVGEVLRQTPAADPTSTLPRVRPVGNLNVGLRTALRAFGAGLAIILGSWV